MTMNDGDSDRLKLTIAFERKLWTMQIILAMASNLMASLLLVAMLFVTSSVRTLLSSDARSP